MFGCLERRHILLSLLLSSTTRWFLLLKLNLGEDIQVREEKEGVKDRCTRKDEIPVVGGRCVSGSGTYLLRNVVKQRRRKLFSLKLVPT